MSAVYISGSSIHHPEGSVHRWKTGTSHLNYCACGRVWAHEATEIKPPVMPMPMCRRCFTIDGIPKDTIPKPTKSEHDKKHREKYAGRYRDQRRLYYHKKRQALLEKQKKYAQNNREKIKERYRRWFEKNKERQLAYIKNWQKNNPDKVKMSVDKSAKRMVVEITDSYVRENLRICGIPNPTPEQIIRRRDKIRRTRASKQLKLMQTAAVLCKL